jgi:hypothetical protein
MRHEGGQATVEWVALILLAAVTLLGLLAVESPRSSAPELGDLLAGRITKAAASGTARLPGSRPTRFSAPLAPRSPRSPAATVRVPASRPPRVSAPVARAPAGPAPAPRTSPPSRAVDAFRRLRGLGAVARRAWIVCLGYRRWRDEMEHPRAPNETLPLDEALDIANTCLNPYSFFTQE